MPYMKRFRSALVSKNLPCPKKLLVARLVLSVNNFGFEVKPSDKPLIEIRKNNGPRIDPLGTPGSTLVQDECSPFKTALW